MFWNKKREAKLLESMKAAEPDRGYWAAVWRRYKKNRMAVWALRLLSVLLLIALLADVLTNDKPIYMKHEGETHWPVFKEYLVSWGWAKWPEKQIGIKWREVDYESVVWPLVPYGATELDMGNAYKSPFDDQKVKRFRFRHHLGTGSLGDDVLAGMIRGTRIAMVIGVLAMSVAALIGIFFGALAGYFGDHRLTISRGRLLLNGIGVFLAFFYAFIARSYALSDGENWGTEFMISIGWFVGVMTLVNLLASLLKLLPFFAKKITIAADLLIMRMIEIFNSIPGLMFLLAMLVIIPQPNIFNMMIIIGLISWTGIARFIRAELLRVRSLEYIEAAEAMGFSKWRILFKHAIPNALGPVLITIAFGIAAAILVEAFLSFLGLGLGVEEMTWGKMLSFARTRSSAWWLAVFPGLAIFLTVSIFNFIGEGLTDAMDPKQRGAA